MQRDFGVAVQGGSAGGSRGVVAGGGAQSGPVGQAPADSSAALTADPAGVYSLRGIYFNRRQFGSTADCLTAASAQGLPLDLCR